MPRRSGLGRGLDALIQSQDSPPASGAVYLPIDQILPNPRQPRDHFDPEALIDLSNSIRQHGILQPLIVTQDEKSSNYILIAGQRRLLAARQAGLDTVPAIIRQANELQRLELALIENIQRADLNPMESAEAYRQLSDEFGLTHDEISHQIGKSRSTVTNTLRLLDLAPEVRKAIAEGKITEGHARPLLRLHSPEAQEHALKMISNHGLNVRQTEELIHKLAGERPVRKSRPAQPAEISDIEDRLSSYFGTRVNLKKKKKGYNLSIQVYSDEELNALLAQLMGE